jgi:hypothetical protein
MSTISNQFNDLIKECRSNRYQDQSSKEENCLDAIQKEIKSLPRVYNSYMIEGKRDKWAYENLIPALIRSHDLLTVFEEGRAKTSLFSKDFSSKLLSCEKLFFQTIEGYNYRGLLPKYLEIVSRVSDNKAFSSLGKLIQKPTDHFPLTEKHLTKDHLNRMQRQVSLYCRDLMSSRSFAELFTYYHMIQLPGCHTPLSIFPHTYHKRPVAQPLFYLGDGWSVTHTITPIHRMNNYWDVAKLAELPMMIFAKQISIDVSKALVSVQPNESSSHPCPTPRLKKRVTFAPDVKTEDAQRNKNTKRIVSKSKIEAKKLQAYVKERIKEESDRFFEFFSTQPWRGLLDIRFRILFEGSHAHDASMEALSITSAATAFVRASKTFSRHYLPFFTDSSQEKHSSLVTVSFQKNWDASKQPSKYKGGYLYRPYTSNTFATFFHNTPLIPTVVCDRDSPLQSGVNEAAAPLTRYHLHTEDGRSYVVYHRLLSDDSYQLFVTLKENDQYHLVPFLKFSSSAMEDLVSYFHSRQKISDELAWQIEKALIENGRKPHYNYSMGTKVDKQTRFIGPVEDWVEENCFVTIHPNASDTSIAVTLPKETKVLLERFPGLKTFFDNRGNLQWEKLCKTMVDRKIITFKEHGIIAEALNTIGHFSIFSDFPTHEYEICKNKETIEKILDVLRINADDATQHNQ